MVEPKDPKDSASTTTTTTTSSDAAMQVDEEDSRLQLPMSRVRRIMKVDKDVQQCTNETTMLMVKATELFLQLVSERAMEETKKVKRKTIQYDDLAAAVQRHDELEFLVDIVPQKLTIKEAMQKGKN